MNQNYFIFTFVKDIGLNLLDIFILFNTVSVSPSEIGAGKCRAASNMGASAKKKEK